MKALLFVLIPLLFGGLIYLLPEGTNSIVRNYLPDGLWAFSFAYAFLWLWNPRLKSALRLLPLILFLGFEFLQFKGIITGTFDLFDCAIYILFYLVASVFHYVHQQKTTP